MCQARCVDGWYDYASGRPQCVVMRRRLAVSATAGSKVEVVPASSQRSNPLLSVQNLPLDDTLPARAGHEAVSRRGVECGQLGADGGCRANDGAPTSKVGTNEGG